MRRRTQHFGWVIRSAKLLLACAIFGASLHPSGALAQTSDEAWDTPLNLSRSGIAKSPALVVDSQATAHAIWQDDIGNFVYSRFDGDEWQGPVTTELERVFGLSTGNNGGPNQESIHTGPNPLFITGSGPYVFAFWISRQGKLLTSRARGESLEHAAAWDTARLITPDVATFVATVDARGEWHLAYIRNVDTEREPSGIYYTHSKNGGANWGMPELLYKSTYLRRLTAGEANLSIATAETAGSIQVYLTWDNRPRKQIFLARSVDAGASWEEPFLVAGPEPSQATGPFNIQVGTFLDTVMLIWQRGEPSNGLLPSCSQIYETSQDAGATWSDPKIMADDVLGCGKSNTLITGLSDSGESTLYAFTESGGKVFLTAWNGTEWSQPQEQPTLAGFEEPEIFTDVIFGCYQSAFVGARLYVLGCDQGGGGDVWVTARELGSTAAWFERSVWSPLSNVSSEPFQIEALELMTTDDGLIHAFLGLKESSAIYYTVWNGEFWSRMAQVMRLPEGEAVLPAIVAAPENELFLITPTDQGSLYFSRATSGNAITASRWSTPKKIELIHDGEIGAVDVAYNSSGTVFVVYSVAVNEDRGIYLVQSEDQGETWSEPLQVFDGTEAGFDVVGGPSLLIADNGTLQIIWKQQAIQGDRTPKSIAVYFARSEDSGRTFSAAKPVVEETFAWHEMVTDRTGALHLFWQRQDANTAVWDQVSLDGGKSWQTPQGLPDQGGLATVTRDRAGRIHLLGVVPGSLEHWIWDSGRWEPETPLQWSVSSQTDAPVNLLATSVNKQGEMVVVLAVTSNTEDTTESSLLFSTRTLKLPPQQATDESTQIPTEPPATEPAAAAPPEQAATSAATVDTTSGNQDTFAPVAANDPIAPFTVAIVPVAIILLGVLGFVVWRAAQNKDH